MTPNQSRSRVGDVRPSQLLYTFGIGSIIDLPHLAVMVMGLDDWQAQYTRELGEERLLAAVQNRLGSQVASLRMPPMAPDADQASGMLADESSRVGVPVASFPTWMRCPRCALLAPIGELFQLKTDAYHPDRSRYVHVSCPNSGFPPAVLPARFLLACTNGHLDDFPWIRFVHKDVPGCRGPLRMKVVGVSGEAADVQVSCDSCGLSRRMVEAIGKDATANLPPCRGFHPHLRTTDADPCAAEVRTMTLGASNSWFPMTLAVLSIPSATDAIMRLVEANWVLLEKATSREKLEGFLDLWRAMGQQAELTQLPLDAVWSRVQQKHGESAASAEQPLSLKDPEWEAFTHPDEARQSSDFRLRVVEPPLGFGAFFEPVVLAERLREAQAFVGFTRIETPGELSDTIDVDKSRTAPISRRPPTWVPAADTRGEGIFLRLNEQRLQAWCQDSVVARREQLLREGHVRWRRRRAIPLPEANFPGIRFVLLHSLAHAIMRQLATECGYAAASIRERIYCAEADHDGGAQAGVLIYTCAPDSEGTLGGLVQLGEPSRLGRHLAQALTDITICASDPLCAEHLPDHDGTALHGAACHACLFAPETSCERGNRYLDRTVLVPAMGSDLPPFFA